MNTKFFIIILLMILTGCTPVTTTESVGVSTYKPVPVRNGDDFVGVYKLDTECEAHHEAHHDRRHKYKHANPDGSGIFAIYRDKEIVDREAYRLIVGENFGHRNIDPQFWNNITLVFKQKRIPLSTASDPCNQGTDGIPDMLVSELDGETPYLHRKRHWVNIWLHESDDGTIQPVIKFGHKVGPLHFGILH